MWGVLRAYRREHPLSMRVHRLKIMQLRRPFTHGTICDVYERNGGSALTVRSHTRQGGDDWKIYIAVCHLRQRPPRRELVLSSGHKIKKRTRNDREPRSVEHEERVRVESTRQV